MRPDPYAPSHDRRWRIVRAEREPDGTVVVAIAGELDLDARAAVDEILLGLETDGTPPTVVRIDLSGVSFLDRGGLRLVGGARGRARAGGWPCAVVAPRSEAARRLLDTLPPGPELVVIPPGRGTAAGNSWTADLFPTPRSAEPPSG